MYFAGREVGEGIEALRRAVRYVLVVVGATAVAMVGSAPAGLAAVPGPRSDLAVTAITPASGDVVGVAAPVEVTFRAFTSRDSSTSVFFGSAIFKIGAIPAKSSSMRLSKSEGAGSPGTSL